MTPSRRLMRALIAARTQDDAKLWQIADEMSDPMELEEAYLAADRMQRVLGNVLNAKASRVGIPGEPGIPGTRRDHVDEDLLRQVTKHVVPAADMAALNRPSASAADQCKAGVTAALRCAGRNGLIRFTPRWSWPETIVRSIERDDPDLVG